MYFFERCDVQLSRRDAHLSRHSEWVRWSVHTPRLFLFCFFVSLFSLPFHAEFSFAPSRSCDSETKGHWSHPFLLIMLEWFFGAGMHLTQKTEHATHPSPALEHTEMQTITRDMKYTLRESIAYIGVTNRMKATSGTYT